jgi:hypothetical protein
MYHLFYDAEKKAYLQAEIDKIVEAFSFYPEGLLKVRVREMSQVRAGGYMNTTTTVLCVEIAMPISQKK